MPAEIPRITPVRQTPVPPTQERTQGQQQQPGRIHVLQQHTLNHVWYRVVPEVQVIMPSQNRQQVITERIGRVQHITGAPAAVFHQEATQHLLLQVLVVLTKAVRRQEARAAVTEAAQVEAVIAVAVRLTQVAAPEVPAAVVQEVQARHHQAGDVNL